MTTAEIVRAAIKSQICPWCGRGPFKMLPVHTAKVHEVDKWELRELAGLTTRDALCSDESIQAMRDAYDAEARADILAKANIAAKKRRPQRWTTAGVERTAENLRRWEREHPEEALDARRSASIAGHQPDAVRRQAASLRATWAKKKGGQ